MKQNYSKHAGFFLFIGAAQFILMMIVAEALYPGYSVSKNMISDLGVGVSAPVFNTSIILLGLSIIICAYYLLREYEDKTLSLLLALAGSGAVGVGTFVETTGTPHFASALIAFFFGAVGTAYAKNKVSAPFSFFCILGGAVSLSALFLTVSRTYYLGLGPGGMERMIVYPILVWCLAFSGALMSKKGTHEQR